MNKNLKYTMVLIALLTIYNSIPLHSRPGGGQSFSDESSSKSSSSENNSYSSESDDDKTWDYQNDHSDNEDDYRSDSDRSSGSTSEAGNADLDGHTVMIIFASFSLIGLGIFNFFSSTLFYDDRLIKKMIPYICFATAGYGIFAIVSHNMELKYNQEVKLAFYVLSGIVAFGAVRLVFGNDRSKSDFVTSSKSVTKVEVVSDIRKQTASLRETDPNFSMILFKEFAHLMYIEFYSNLGKPSLVKLMPYIQLFDPEMINGSTYTEIVIGELKVAELAVEKQNRILVKFYANYTEIKKNTGEYVRHQIGESWVFRRAKGVLTPEPEHMQVITCPSCGAAADYSDAGICSFCNNTVLAGEMQWTLSDRYIFQQNKFEVNGLGYYAEEKGTDLNTIVSAYIEKDAIQLANVLGLPAEEQTKWWETYSHSFCNDLAINYFIQIYLAWSVNKLENIRPLISDRLFHSFKFWIDNYSKAGLQNKLDKIVVNKVEMCKIEQDKHYLALTTRIHANCLDYTIDKEGKIIGGSDKVPRKFTEYWVFIRRLDKNFEKSYVLNKCPSCGAEIDKMGETAICGYCNAKLSTGNFSWVLSNIVQDEVYRG